MLQKIIKSNTILLAPLRAIFFPGFYSHIRGIVFQSHSRLKLSLLRNIYENELIIRKVYIWRGFTYALNFALGIGESKNEH